MSRFNHLLICVRVINGAGGAQGRPLSGTYNNPIMSRLAHGNEICTLEESDVNDSVIVSDMDGNVKVKPLPRRHRARYVAIKGPEGGIHLGHRRKRSGPRERSSTRAPPLSDGHQCPLPQREVTCEHRPPAPSSQHLQTRVISPYPIFNNTR